MRRMNLHSCAQDFAIMYSNRVKWEVIEILTPWTTQLIFCFILNHIFYYVLNKFRCQNGFLSISIRLIYAIFLITVLLSFNAEILFIKLCIIDLLGEEIQFDPQKLPRYIKVFIIILLLFTLRWDRGTVSVNPSSKSKATQKRDMDEN